MNKLRKFIQELTRYPTAIASLVLIFLMVVFSIYTIIKIPYADAVRLWRGAEEDWYKSPKQVAPAWMNWFNKEKEPLSFTLDDRTGTAIQTVETDAQGLSKVTFTYTFDYQYDRFPQDLFIHLTSQYVANKPLISITWTRPDGSVVNIPPYSILQNDSYQIATDEKLARILRVDDPQKSLLGIPKSDPPVVQKGKYTVVVTAHLFEPNTTIDGEFILIGKLAGLAGTDHMRRDLIIPLMWGLPIALAFGILAAAGTTFTTLCIGAVSAWFGGWLDELIQRIVEINNLLPFYPLLIMIGALYSRSIWLILGVVIGLGIFGLQVKNDRAMFMQIREMPFIEAARSYGASNWRIIIRYMVPRVIPTQIPALVTLVPTYVFLEAGLAVLGLGDPFLPTWGKVIGDANAHGALYQGYYYWVLEPTVLLFITALAFSLLSFALDRIFNPRLRDQ